MFGMGYFVSGVWYCVVCMGCLVWGICYGYLTLSIWNRIIGMVHFVLGVRHEVVGLMCLVWFVWYGKYVL